MRETYLFSYVYRLRSPRFAGKPDVNIPRDVVSLNQSHNDVVFVRGDSCYTRVRLPLCNVARPKNENENENGAARLDDGYRESEIAGTNFTQILKTRAFTRSSRRSDLSSNTRARRTPTGTVRSGWVKWSTASRRGSRNSGRGASPGSTDQRST